MTTAIALNTEVFDSQSVLDMVDGELDFMQELIELFLTDLPGQRESVRQAIATGDAKTVQSITHRLKSSVGNLGGVRARPHIIELEHLARTGCLDGARELFNRCTTELDAFEQALRDFLEENGLS